MIGYLLVLIRTIRVGLGMIEYLLLLIRIIRVGLGMIGYLLVLVKTIGVSLRLIGYLFVLIKIIQLDPGMIRDHRVPIGTIYNMIELDLVTIEGHLVLYPSK